MAALPASASGSLTLEVWLGPMEGIRCSRNLDTDPCVVRMGRRPGDEKSGVKNDLVLGDSERISGRHAELRASGGILFLKDLKSTNGTYASGRRVSGEVEIQENEVFLLSTTPIQVTLSGKGRSPAESEIPAGELGATASLQKMLAAVRASARRRKDNFADTRHLADALLRGADPAVEGILESAGLAPKKALEELWGQALFHGRREWVFRFLDAPVESPKPSEPVLTTRVNAIFGAAARQLSGLGESEAAARVSEALLALLLDSPGPVGAWLAEHGVTAPAEKTEPQRSRASRTERIHADDDETLERRPPAPQPVKPRPARPAPASTAPEPRPTAPPPAAPPPEPPPAAAPAVATVPVPAVPQPPAAPVATPQAASTGDVVLDQRARAIALEIEEATILYRFSTPEDRRSAIKTVVTRALAAVAPENRTRILSQIRVQFPVIAAPPVEVSADVPRLLRRIEELEKQVTELSAARAPAEKPAPAALDASWQGILSPGPVERGAPAEVAVLKELVEFARRLEKFLLGLIQSVTMPGNATASFRLGAYRYSLESILTAMRQGKSFDRERLPEYLRELERWQVAILAGHHKSAGVWFGQFWGKVGPAAIEASAARPATWKLQGGAVDFWNRYREAVKGLDAEVVQDQVLQVAYRVAQEEFDKLTKRRAQ